MKSRIFTSLLALAMCIPGAVIAQTYTHSTMTGSYPAAPYLSSEYKIVHNGQTTPTDDEFSAWQTLPFNFTYFDTTIKGYKISDNGYITFNKKDGFSNGENTLLPDASAPLLAIFGFWDGFEIRKATQTAYAGYTLTWTTGTAPNRIHHIQWFGVSNQNSSDPNYNNIYFTIRLYESGDFEIIHQMRREGVGELTGTVGYSDMDGDGVMVEGPDFNFPDVTATESEDDVVYRFTRSNNNNDVAVTEVDLSDKESGGVELLTMGQNYNITGVVENRGTSLLNSFDINYSINGGPTQTMPRSSVSVSPITGRISFNHNVPVSAATGGQAMTIRVWADNPNGQADQNDKNNEMSLKAAVVNGEGFNTVAKPIVEEFSGAWCGYCPDGLTRLEALQAQYPGAIIVSIHGPTGSQDQMLTTEGGQIANAFVTGYPSAAINRIKFPGEPIVGFSDRSLWIPRYEEALNNYTPVVVTMEQHYNYQSREVEVEVTAKFVDYPVPVDGASYRISLYVVEDNVVGEGVGYDQVNYYNKQQGSPFYNLGDPIKGYVHRDVFRDVAGPAGPWGEGGIIPANPEIGKEYKKTFYYTMENDWVLEELSSIGFVSYYHADVTKRQILNAEELGINEVYSGVEEKLSAGGMEVYPNPASQQINAVVNFENPVMATFAVYNMLGQQVTGIPAQQYQAGQQQVSFDISTLTPGVYYLSMEADGQVTTQKIVVAE
ncbi:MAG: Omp28-related outer membrane protein [Bacteroidota bacterium]|nr:Omp28-related outer membrane protein [Bacteroidota bacterium]